jgi:all-trans-retinol 13,14-reductase
MEVGLSYKQKRPEGAFDAIVIGTGMGGLAAAAALAKRKKKRVLLLERHYTAGGFTHAFTRPGYEWDVGVHYIGQVGPRSMLRAPFDWLSDGALTWARMPDVYDRVYLGDRTYDFVTGSKRFVSKMKEYFPEEGDAIEKYVSLILEVTKSATTAGLEAALPKVASAVLGPLLTSAHLKYATRTTLDVLSELTQNKELISVLTAQFGDYGLPPARSSFVMHASVASHYLAGGYFPVGGASAIARSIAPVIERAGGQIFVNAEVKQILIENGRAVGVRMADDSELRAPVVISDAGAMNTYERLLPEANRDPQMESTLKGVGASVSYLCLYLGMKHTDEELGLTGTNMWIYPNGDSDATFDRFMKEPEITPYLSEPLPLVYISFPSAKDPTWMDRYPGRSTVDVIVPAKFDWFARWDGTRWKKRGNEYDALKAKLQELILEATYEKLPQLRGKVDYAELSTPLSAKHFSGYQHGELYGLDHSPDRYRMRLRAKTEIPGLYLAGQDLVSCGVAGAMFGGLLAAAAIGGPGILVAAMKG